MREPVYVATQTWMFDPGANVGINEIAGAVRDDGDWQVDVLEARERPPGAASTHHVRDVVGARRVT